LRLDPTIFREYDIRGVVGENIDSQVCTVLGAAYGSMLQEAGHDTVVVGRDGRLSSPDLARALISGLMGTGCKVIDIGVATTPMMYFAVKHLDTAGGISVTASHNPPQYNGLKMRKGTLPFSGDDIQHLRRVAEEGPFHQGMGRLSQGTSILDEYLAAILGRVQIDRAALLVIDAGSGATGPVAPELFRRLGCDVVELYCELDGRFPHHFPDPSDRENLQDLVAAVREHRADLGVAYDGDGDRVGVVTDAGEILSGDLIVAIMAREMLKREQGSVVFDLLSSRTLIDVIERHGGMPLMAPTGYARVMAEVKRNGALIGGEASGHIFLGDDLFDFDDGIFASAMLLESVSAEGLRVSELVGEFPRYHSAPEIRLACADEHKFAVMDRIREHLAQRFELVDLDGLRLEFKDGWASVRASHTTPAIALVFEAATPRQVEELKTLLKAELETCCAPEIAAGILDFEGQW
jgi:phosphomannomutase/phosphoglucomutase